jgi:ABC-type transport system involved in Fe-S cluster assembly fused permease/ATPase subunit
LAQQREAIQQGRAALERVEAAAAAAAVVAVGGAAVWVWVWVWVPVQAWRTQIQKPKAWAAEEGGWCEEAVESVQALWTQTE